MFVAQFGCKESLSKFAMSNNLLATVCSLRTGCWRATLPEYDVFARNPRMHAHTHTRQWQ